MGPPCTVCGCENAADAKFCSECGALLKARSRPVTSAPAAPFPDTSPVPHTSGDELPVLTLLPLDPLPPSAPPSASAAHPLVGLIRSDPDPPRAMASESGVARSAAKARRRAQVRRARVAASGQVLSREPESTDVLVFERDDASLRHLSELLEGFGFVVYPARSIGQADALLAVHHYVAVVLDVELDGRLDGPAAVLCQHAKRSAAGAGARSPGLIVITERARPADRVRASLAGADGVLVRPPSRGDLARALEDIGVVLPSDPRAR